MQKTRFWFSAALTPISKPRGRARRGRRLGIPAQRMSVPATSSPTAATPRPASTGARAGIGVVTGNCEEQLAADAEDCGCGFAPGSACDRLSAPGSPMRARLDPDDRDWMAALPRRLDIAIAGLSWPSCMAPHETSRFVFASAPVAHQGARPRAVRRRRHRRRPLRPAVHARWSAAGCGTTPGRSGCRPTTARRASGTAS